MAPVGENSPLPARPSNSPRADPWLALGRACLDAGRTLEGGRRVEALLDTEDIIQFRYVLEVSSPGLNRPLRKPEHFERFTGERVHIRMADSFGPRRRFSGKLLGLKDGVVCVQSDDGETIRLPFDSLRSARAEIDPWKRRV